jgi:FkbM family methyltransferase
MKKILNLYRVNYRNKILVIKYLFKTVLKIKPKQNEIIAYSFYCGLIITDSVFLNESDTFFIMKNREIEYHKIKIRKSPSSDLEVYLQIFYGKEYQPVVDLYKKNCKNEKEYKLNIIDAGSNIGLTTLYFLNQFENANVICIEPEKENFKILTYNLESTTSNINKVNGGIWSSNTNLKIVRDFRDMSDWGFRVEETDGDEGIKAYTINELIKNNSFDVIDILKIDIEGSEKELFLNDRSDLYFLNITKVIAIEIHDEFNCRNEIYDVLKKFEFNYFDVGQTTIGINKKYI